MSRRSPKPCRHRGAAPYPGRADPGARWQTLCDTDRAAPGTCDSLTRDHKSAAALFLNWSGRSLRHDCASLWILRLGTDGSNPVFSSGESGANLISVTNPIGFRQRQPGAASAPHDKRDGLVGYGLDCSQSLGSAAMRSTAYSPFIRMSSQPDRAASAKPSARRAGRSGGQFLRWSAPNRVCWRCDP
jgi:hypothetical protein